MMRRRGSLTGHEVDHCFAPVATRRERADRLGAYDMRAPASTNALPSAIEGRRCWSASSTIRPRAVTTSAFPESRPQSRNAVPLEETT